MSDNVTLDRVDFQKIKDQAAAARVEYMRRHGTFASEVVGSTLRTYSVIAIAAILIISFGVKMFVLSPPTADAGNYAVPSASMNILQMQVDHPNLPAQQINDMTFVDPLP